MGDSLTTGGIRGGVESMVRDADAAAGDVDAGC